MLKLLQMGHSRTNSNGSLDLGGFLSLLLIVGYEMLAMISEMDWIHISAPLELDI